MLITATLGLTVAWVRRMQGHVRARRDLEAQLRQTQKMDAVGRLAAGIAHDFNNLIAVILANCEEGRSALDSQAATRDRFDVIRAAAESASSLARQLLSFSRRQSPERRAMNVNAIVTDTSRLIERLLTRDIEMQVRLDPHLWLASVDPGQVQQVLVNLVMNAVDAMPCGGRLTVETRNVLVDRTQTTTDRPIPPGEYVQLAVSDTGTGMDNATLARIFEPFFTTKAAGKGTGLGLSTVRWIVRESGGLVHVESEPGRGSRFSIYLPRVESGAHVPSSSAARAEPQATGEMVLLVEDNAAVLAMTRTSLTRLGYHVLAVSSSAEAVALCADYGSKPALLITDIVLPDGSGPSLAGQLRGMIPHLKVLYMSGYPDAPASDRWRVPRGAPFLAKPFVIRELAAKVRAILDESP